MLTPAWTQLRYHKQQSALWRTSKRFVAASAGRGSGKTEVCRRRVVRFLPVRKPWNDPLYFYALPTYNQARRVAWNKILQLVPRKWTDNGKLVSESQMIIKTIFGSSLYVVGLDKPQRIEGDQWDGGVVDESSDQKPGVFDRNILPALSHKNGWCFRIGVPKRYGCGAVEFREFCENVAEESYTWPSSDILTEEQLQFAKENLDSKDYNEQYNASWERAGGLIFHAFEEVSNVENILYNPSLPIIVGSDFNVDPMSWILAHEVNDELHVFDEIFIRDTNTQQTLNFLYEKYGSHNRGFDFHGDATGKARKTSAALSDYIQIKNDSRFTAARVFYTDSNPPRADRFAACNSMLRNAEGKRRVKISSQCENLIRDLKTRTYVQGTSDADDYGDVGHMTDAFGYVIHYKWPIRYTATREMVSVGASVPIAL